MTLMEQGKTFAEALRTRTFEPDGPNCTPRISGCGVAEDGSYQTVHSEVCRRQWRRAVQRYFFDYPQPVAGEGHFIQHLQARR